MAFPVRKLQHCCFLLILHHVALVAPGRGESDDGCYTSMFSFGDSLTDTGNLCFISPPQTPNCLLPPYGNSYFHHPNGRCSDGRLIPDFIADYMGIPYLKPYLGFKNGAVPRHSIQHGLNFAVAGATALDRTFFQEKGFVVDAAANYSLMVQLDWFKDVLTYLCTSPSSCEEFLRSSLFIVGEIGGNDYGYPLSETTDFEVLRSYVTQVVSVVTSVIIELIDLGARTLMVPGSLPLGCNPAYLTSCFKSSFVGFKCCIPMSISSMQIISMMHCACTDLQNNLGLVQIISRFAVEVEDHTISTIRRYVAMQGS
ncbi:hypothetical protein AAHE18_10G016600 [Arachis hypogaea]